MASAEEEAAKFADGFMTVEDFRGDDVKADEPAKQGPGRPKKAQDE